MSTVYPQTKEKAVARETLPIYLILAGIVASIAVGVDFLDGNARLGYLSPAQIRFIFAALAIFAGGLILDLTLGQRFTLRWLGQAVTSRRDAGKFIAISLELALLTLLIREFKIGNESFYQAVAIVIFLGFFVHYLLPLPYRLPFFFLLSLLGIQAVFGWLSAAWLVGIGLVLIGMCHLPIPFVARVSLLLTTGAFLALLRMDKVFHAPSLRVIWPVLGSMFMFRLIVYLYDLRHDKTPVSIPATLSYFFLLPNVVFPLFPVVDYKTFRRTYYDADHHEIYQRGVEWMFRGVFQLILYRLVYNYATISTAEVDGAATLVRYIVANFALYLRVSGSFHLIVGILQLFGFHLPETNHRYFLSSSFTDFWRRANIYWKDFMMKLFFYPSYFRFKKWGNTTALVLSTILVFTCTWLLHSYQWFWLRGKFPLTKVDMLFWGMLALLVLANSLYEAKHGRKRVLGKPGLTLGTLGPLALRTAGTFAVISVLWSLWTADSVSEWAAMLHVAGKNVSSSLMLLPVFFFVAAIASAGIQSAAVSARKPLAGFKRAPATIYRSICITVASTIVLLLIGNPAIYSRFGAKVQATIRDIRVEGLNKRDAALLRRGYYEELIGAERFNSQLWEVNMRRPTYWPDINETEAAQNTGDFLSFQLRPFASIVFKGQPFSTNRWGMRDQDYELKKPPHTYRYALLGASPEMGSGIADNQTFESLLETRLNRERSSNSSYARYEILNFAVGGYTPLQFVWVLEHKVFDFQPDAVLYVAHANDEDSAARYLAKMVRAGVDIPYEYLKDLARRANVDRSTPMDVAEKLLQPYHAELLSWAYSQVAEDCRRHGVQPLWIFMGDAGLNTPPEAIALHLRLAQQAGLSTIDLHDWFENQDIKRVTVAEWDWHPNAEGQKLIASRLYDALQNTTPLRPSDSL